MLISKGANPNIRVPNNGIIHPLLIKVIDGIIIFIYSLLFILFIIINYYKKEPYNIIGNSRLYSPTSALGTVIIRSTPRNGFFNYFNHYSSIIDY